MTKYCYLCLFATIAIICLYVQFVGIQVGEGYVEYKPHINALQPIDMKVTWTFTKEYCEPSNKDSNYSEWFYYEPFETMKTVQHYVNLYFSADCESLPPAR